MSNKTKIEMNLYQFFANDIRYGVNDALTIELRMLVISKENKDAGSI